MYNIRTKVDRNQICKIKFFCYSTIQI